MKARKRSPYPRVAHPRWEQKSWKEAWAHPIPELFHTGQKNPTDLAPTLDKTHEDAKKQEYAQLEGHNSKAPGYAYND
jgi:hypothetical protein